MLTKQTYFIILKDGTGRTGVGEIPLFKGLSAEDSPRFPAQLKHIELVVNTQLQKDPDIFKLIETARDEGWPSCVRFGIESAVADLNAKDGVMFPSSFTDDTRAIYINGLIWMGDRDMMFQRIEEKLSLGFHCLKLKIGGIDFDQELELLRHIRTRFSADQLTIRLDANCAFSPENAVARLDKLSMYDIHSIEQPLSPSVPWNIQREIFSNSPIPVALDESLIGITPDDAKTGLLEEVKPAYIILKPSLCGGFYEAERWIDIAEERNIGWWITSALESNIGLNAIAQWTGQYNVKIPQGLGTGGLYTNNFPAPIVLEAEIMRFLKDEASEIAENQRASILAASAAVDNSLPESRLTSGAIDWWRTWNADTPTVHARTSGSTGVPKDIDLYKEDMVRSALATNRFFDIDENAVLLCPLSTDYIAGKMMIVRTEVAGAKLIVCPPDQLESLLIAESQIDLLAIVPAQLDTLFRVTDSAQKIKNILIGGSPLSDLQERSLIEQGYNAFVSYGMTETCSHIALRKVGDPFYTALQGISLSVDSDNCLVIENHHAHYGCLVTNDIVDLNDERNAFRWIGRRDNVIISGGKKFFPEEIENALMPCLPFTFYIVGRPDSIWGETITLVAECNESVFCKDDIIALCRRSGLHRHSLPKRIEYVKELPRTSTGKVKRL